MRRRWIVAIALGVSLVGGVALAQMGPGGPGPGMGPGMMMGPGGHPGPGMGPGVMMGGSRFERPLISEILSVKDQLGVTADQEQKLTSLRSGFEKEAIRRGAEIQAAEVDLRELLAAETPDLANVEAQVRKIAGLEGDLRFARIKVLQAGLAVLTKEQRQKFEALPPRAGRGGHPGHGMGPGGMMMGPGMMGDMGPGGPGAPAPK